MESIKEFKELLENKDSFLRFCDQYFMAYSKDQKYISIDEYSEIIMQICDERGIDTPSNEEINEWERKKDSELGIQKKEKMEIKKRSLAITNMSYESFTHKVKLIFELLIEKN